MKRTTKRGNWIPSAEILQVAVCKPCKELKLMAERMQAATTEGTIEYDALKKTAGKGKTVYWEGSRE